MLKNPASIQPRAGVAKSGSPTSTEPPGRINSAGVVLGRLLARPRGDRRKRGALSRAGHGTVGEAFPIENLSAPTEPESKPTLFVEPSARRAGGVDEQHAVGRLGRRSVHARDP